MHNKRFCISRYTCMYICNLSRESCSPSACKIGASELLYGIERLPRNRSTCTLEWHLRYTYIRTYIHLHGYYLSIVYVMRKVWIGTIRRLSCTIYGSTNCAIICGLRTQSMDCTVRKVWIETIHGLFCANCGSPWIVHTCLAQSMALTACIKR